MFVIKEKRKLNSTVTLMEIVAPHIAKKAEPGQFVILRVEENGERIPLTIADFDREKGTITIIFQIVGATTEKLNHKEIGDCLCDFVGPLGMPTDLNHCQKVAVIGGGVGCAIAYPIAKKLFEMGNNVTTIVGFRSKDLVILEDELNKISHRFIKMSDDGSFGQKGLVTHALAELLKSGETFDQVICIGPLAMMKYVAICTKPYHIRTIASMNSIMIDGTGMCGCCRLMINGKMKFACVDGPDFDAHLIDFDEAMARSSMYRDFERRAHEETCNLFKGAKS